MLMWLGVSLGIAFGSALLPLISIEVFLIGLAAREPDIPWLALGAVIAVGQVGGKLIYYYAARGALCLPAFLRRKPKAPRDERKSLRAKRIRAWFSRITERCRRHPRWMLGTYGVSSLIGLPPFMATTVMAGVVRMSPAAFVSTGLLGRFIRFSLLAAAPALCTGWLF